MKPLKPLKEKISITIDADILEIISIQKISKTKKPRMLNPWFFVM